MHPAPQLPHDCTTYTGHDVLDTHGHHVGKITDVIYDDAVSAPVEVAESPTEPAWIVVNPGVMRAAHYVPVAGSYRTDEGTVVVPWDKDWIKSATKASGDHVLNADQIEELVTHYSLSS